MSEEQNKYALLQTVAPPKPQRELTTWEERQAQRKAEEDAIRNRVRGARTDKAVFIPALPKPKYDDKGYKRVAVYARVSTKSIEQVSSIENQTRYYSEKIESTPDWDLQEIYSDDGFSGTSIKRRKAFLKMMEDAKDKKMDLILCASVSRFARNMSECMEQIGVSLEVRKKRDALFKFMSEQDIITQGTVVENPLIGNIPSRQMVEDELEELLMCM